MSSDRVHILLDDFWTLNLIILLKYFRRTDAQRLSIPVTINCKKNTTSLISIFFLLQIVLRQEKVGMLIDLENNNNNNNNNNRELPTERGAPNGAIAG